MTTIQLEKETLERSETLELAGAGGKASAA